jgi:hypothetical protein
MASANRQAADVRINEVDLTSSIVSNSNAYMGFVGISSQGPTDWTFYSSPDNFTFDWGYPKASVSFDHYAAADYFKEGNGLWARRVVGSGALYSGAIVKNSSAGVTSIGGISAGVVDPTDPQWDDYIGVGDVALYLVTSKRGQGSYGDNIAVSIESADLNQVTGVAATTEVDTGSLATGSYKYRVAAIGENGEALASSEVTIAVPGGETASSNTITWTAVPGALGYYIYGRVTGSIGRIASVGGATTSYTDLGVITPDGAFDPITDPGDLPTPSPIFTLNVYDTAQSSTKPVESFLCSVTEQVDEIGAQMEITQRVNPFSKYIRVESNVFSLLSTPSVKSVVTPVNLDGGASGSAPLTSDLNSAVAEILNKELYTVDVITSNGRSDVSFMRKLEEVARTRGDAVAFLDVPSNAQTAQAAIDFRNLTLNLNSSYAALFASDLLEMDPVNGKMLYVPPSGAMAGLYARTSRVAQPWFSIAGLNRGLTDAIDVRTSFNDTDSTRLFQAQVNYMRKFVGKGIPLWEQSTLYNRNSALQFLNVRFLCNLLKRSMYDFLLYGLQEPGDDILRRQLKLGLEEFLKLVKSLRGISSYRVVIDSTNNPSSLVNSGILAIAVVIVPILAVREIRLTLVLSKEGLEVTESDIASF